MMADIIRIAKSPAYHTRMPVKTPTYAVALISFDLIHAMVFAAQLIEQAHTFGANTPNLKHLLARALFAGTQAQELGKAIKYGETASLFTNPMFYPLEISSSPSADPTRPNNLRPYAGRIPPIFLKPNWLS